MKGIAHLLKLRTVVFLFNGQLVFNFKCILHSEKDTKKEQSYFIFELIALFLVANGRLGRRVSKCPYRNIRNIW